MSGEDDLARFRREFAAMNDKVQRLSPDDPVALAEVHAFLSQQRAAPTPALVRAVADAYYLQGKTVEALGEELGRSHAAVAYWLKGEHAPEEYVAVRKVDDSYEMRRVPVKPSVASRQELAGLRSEGWRVAPATMQADPEWSDAAAKALWRQLGASSAR